MRSTQFEILSNEHIEFVLIRNSTKSLWNWCQSEKTGILLICSLVLSGGPHNVISCLDLNVARLTRSYRERSLLIVDVPCYRLCCTIGVLCCECQLRAHYVTPLQPQKRCFAFPSPKLPRLWVWVLELCQPVRRQNSPLRSCKECPAISAIRKYGPPPARGWAMKKLALVWSSAALTLTRWRASRSCRIQLAGTLVVALHMHSAVFQWLLG